MAEVENVAAERKVGRQLCERLQKRSYGAARSSLRGHFEHRPESIRMFRDLHPGHAKHVQTFSLRLNIPGGHRLAGL
eukprot:scaffold7123_cov119-Isochrysis_galbana.AAC.10